MRTCIHGPSLHPSNVTGTLQTTGFPGANFVWPNQGLSSVCAFSIDETSTIALGGPLLAGLLGESAATRIAVPGAGLRPSDANTAESSLGLDRAPTASSDLVSSIAPAASSHAAASTALALKMPATVSACGLFQRSTPVPGLCDAGRACACTMNMSILVQSDFRAAAVVHSCFGWPEGRF